MMDLQKAMFIQKGAFKNEFGVQRGSVMDMPVYPGDPLTPGVGADSSAKRIASHNEAPNLLKIPVLTNKLSRCKTFA